MIRLTPIDQSLGGIVKRHAACRKGTLVERRRGAADYDFPHLPELHQRFVRSETALGQRFEPEYGAVDFDFRAEASGEKLAE